MKITAAVENTSKDEALGHEHGLSIYIETANHKILFDTGKTDLFLQNAEKLGIDISAVDTLIISHGHYDHGGGLSAFLSHNKNAKIYINEHAFSNFCTSNGRYIGLDISLAANERFIFTSNEFKIDDELCLMTYNDKPRPFFMNSFGLGVKVDNDIVMPDKFLHEQYLIITDDEKTALISGCSHKGILNIMKWAENFKPNAVIGGFHLMELELDEDGKNQILNMADELLKYDTEYYTCHCTGEQQYKLLKGFMKDKIDYLYTGKEINI